MSFEKTKGEEESGVDPMGRRVFTKGLAAFLGGVAMGVGMPKHAEADKSSAEKDAQIEAVLRDWELYKRMVAESSIRDNIDFLEHAYGDTGRELTFKLRSDLMLFDQLVAAEAAGESLVSGPNLGLLRAAVEDYRLYWDRRMLDATVSGMEQRGLQASFTGFDLMPGWDNEKIRQFLENHFDRRWLYGNISSFVYIPSEKRGHAIQIAGEAFGEGLDGVFYRSGRERVQIYAHQGSAEQQNILALMSHEIGHHQDWSANNRLTFPERLQFLRETTERLTAPDRFHFVYVEIDTPTENQGQDSGRVRYAQVTEYWAMLVGQYFMARDKLRTNKPKDFAFVEKWYRRLVEDPL